MPVSINRMSNNNYLRTLYKMITKDCNVTNQNNFCKVLLCKCNMFDKYMWYINYGQKKKHKI